MVTLYTSINFEERFSLFVKILQLRNFFYLEIKLFYLYVNTTNCMQDEEFLIIEENGE